jgi:uncharacterized membrane protein YraQ (UPF0718 family)
VTTATIFLWTITLVLIYCAWRRDDDSLKRGVTLGWITLKRYAALLIVAFILVGFVNVLSPTQLIEDWLGPNTGFRGLLLAEIIGMVLPGGPYAVFPIIGILYGSGAGLGPAVTIITSWSTQGLLSISFEIPFMGWRFSVIRWGLGLGFPLIAGAVALFFFG